MLGLCCFALGLWISNLIGGGVGAIITRHSHTGQEHAAASISGPQVVVVELLFYCSSPPFFFLFYRFNLSRVSLLLASLNQKCVFSLHSPVPLKMTSFRPPLAGPASDKSSGSSTSNAQYTPVSDGSVEGQSSRNPGGPLKIQTDFGDVQDPFSEDDGDSFNYNDEARPKFSRPRVPKYTPVEEQQVVRRFDRRLVPFLALLYLLSFLDRSS